jgi:hypothetical protein
MFDILGLAPHSKLLGFGEISGLVHPDDVQLYELAKQLTDDGPPRSTACSACARARQLGLAARALRAGAPAGRAAARI